MALAAEHGRRVINARCGGGKAHGECTCVCIRMPCAASWHAMAAHQLCCSGRACAPAAGEGCHDHPVCQLKGAHLPGEREPAGVMKPHENWPLSQQVQLNQDRARCARRTPFAAAASNSRGPASTAKRRFAHHKRPEQRIVCRCRQRRGLGLLIVPAGGACRIKEDFTLATAAAECPERCTCKCQS